MTVAAGDATGRKFAPVRLGDEDTAAIRRAGSVRSHRRLPLGLVIAFHPADAAQFHSGGTAGSRCLPVCALIVTPVVRPNSWDLAGGGTLVATI